MNLEEVNTKLMETTEELATSLTKLFPLEMEYTTRYNQLMMNSPRANQASREAEALETLKLEDIYIKYQTAKLDTKILYTRLETYKEVSRNMRNLAFSEN